MNIGLQQKEKENWLCVLIKLAKIPLILVFISVVQFVNSLPDEAFLNVFTELCDVYMAVSQLAPQSIVFVLQHQFWTS